MLGNASKLQVALFSTISWCLWQRWNRLRENQPTWSLKEVGERASMLVREFLDTCNTNAGPSGPIAPVRWSRPPEGNYKVNFDATMFENIGCASIRVAIRDSSKGKIIAALSQRIPLPFLVEMSKAMAARAAALIEQEMCLSKVMMEGDCLRVVSALNSMVGCNTLYGNVVKETRQQAC